MSDIREQLEASIALAEQKRQGAAGALGNLNMSAFPSVGRMNRSAAVGKIAGALAKAQGAVKGAVKDSTNPHFSSRYADLAAVWEACRAALAANEIAVVQSPSADGNLVRLTTLLIHSSGEWIESDPLQVQARDAGPQSVGSCLTYLRRYQLSALAGVAPEDDDAEAATNRAKPARQTPVRQASVAPPGVDPHTGEDTSTQAPTRHANAHVTPQGGMLIQDLRESGGWYHVGFAGFNADGSLKFFKTKLTKLGEIAKDAYQHGIPVKCELVPNTKAGEEGWLNKIEKLDAAGELLHALESDKEMAF